LLRSRGGQGLREKRDKEVTTEFLKKAGGTVPLEIETLEDQRKDGLIRM
jgi:hypothetical protein